MQLLNNDHCSAPGQKPGPLFYKYLLDPKARVEYVSINVLTMTGYSPEDFYCDPMFWLKVVHPIDRWEIQSQVIAGMKENYRFILRIIHKSGVTLWTESYACPVKSREGKIIAIEGVVLDITAQQQVEENRAQAFGQEREARYNAERVAKLREDYLSSVSHDLKNRLTAIFLKVQLALKELSGPEKVDLNKAIAQLDHLGKETYQMTALINDLLSAAQMEVNKFKLDTPLLPHGANHLVKEVLDLLKPVAEEKALQFKTHLPEKEVSIFASYDQIKRVLENIVSNAIKFSPRGENIEIAIDSNEDSVLFKVSDKGPGIPKEELPYIFDRFWQEKSSSKLGSGLGLAISHGIVQAHGGQIWADSKPGSGSTFQFSVPRAELSQAA